MIYRILVNDSDIYGNTQDLILISPSMEMELNSAGSLEFTMPPNHALYEVFPDLTAMTSVVEVYEDEDLIFFGRPISIEKDFYNKKKVTCEGALAFFNDSIQRPQEWESVLVSTFFKHLISVHNAQVPDNRQFMVGNITITDKYVYRKLSYETTFDALQNMCIDTEGGYLFMRREEGVNYIDWLTQVPYVATQPVQFAVNLIDLSQTFNGEDICTAVIPLGMNISRAAKVNESTAYMSIYESKDTSSTVVGRVEQGTEVTFDFITGDEDWYRISNPYDGYAQSQYLDIESGDVPLTIGPANNNIDILEDATGISNYGRITKVQTFSTIKKPSELKEKGQKWLDEEQYDKLCIEADAAELHYIDSSQGAFKVGQMVNVVSTPHLIDVDLPMTKISVSLDSGIKKIQIGTPPHKTLTEIYKDGQY